MPDELAMRLRKLQDARDADVIEEAVYQASLAKLRAEHGAVTVDALLRSSIPADGSRSHTAAASGDAQVGAAVAGDVRGDVVAPLFTDGASGNYIAGVINLYQQAPADSRADYDAALRRYLAHLYARYATIDLRGIDDRPMDMPLGELYVALRLHEPPPDELRGPGALRGFIEKVRGVLGRPHDDTDAQLVETARSRAGGEAQSVSWPMALRHPRIAVVGAPGSGKTTLLHYTAVRLAEALARDDDARLADLGLAGAPPVPLLLPLRELGAYLRECGGREATGANPRLLLDCLSNLYNHFDLDLPPDFFRRLCEAGRALLLLDGLDEVAVSTDRTFVSAIVREFATRYGACRYVVTARVAAYQGDAQIGAGFRICTVADLDAEQQQRFIANWSRSLHRLVYDLSGVALEREAGRYAGDLWRALEGNARVQTLATNPLLLTVVAVIFYNNYVLPEDRAALYEECVEVLLRGGRGKADRAAQQRAQFGGRPDLTMGLNPKRELLAAVAYAMHQRGEAGVFVSRDELTRLVAGHLRHRPDAAEAAQTFVEELPVHIGLLDEREPDRFRFSHLSLQEFLAARHAAETDRWDELLAHYAEPWWREVILLCAGHLSQERCWKFLERLIGMGGAAPEQHAIALALAADALGELERFKGQGPLNGRIVADALAILDLPPSAAPAAARVTCGRALAQLGDPRSGVCTLPPPMVRFAGGRFVIGESRENKQHDDKVNDQPMTVSSFELAIYPVTNAQYALFIADDGYNAVRSWWDAAGRAWLRDAKVAAPRFWDYAQFGRVRANHPVVGISWYEATAFCRWLTRHLADGYVYALPSEAEWEYAARGAQRRPYPWGHQPPDDERANFGGRNRTTTPVGCFPLGATPEGLMDLAGNVWEWTRSAYAPYPYDRGDGRERPDDPANKCFTVRGGSWAHRSIDLRASSRYDHSPDNHNNYLGFRLARHLPL